MRALALIIASISLCFPLRAQSPFPFQLGSAGLEYGKCAALAPDGSLLFGILFQNTIDFDPGAGTSSLGTPPGIDCAIVKYDPSGTLRWARHISGPATGTGSTVTITPHGITTDPEGNVIVIGYFGISGSALQCSVDFDPGPGVATLTNTGGWDPFVLKLDPDGNYLWAVTIGATSPGTTDERLWDVAADPDGSLYASGFIQGTFDIDPGPATASVTSAGEKDHLVLKLSANGSFLWGFTIPDSGDTATSLKENSLALAADGRLFFVGHFNNTADFDPGEDTASLTSAGMADLAIVRYSARTGRSKRLSGSARLSMMLPRPAPPASARTATCISRPASGEPLTSTRAPAF